MPTLSIKNAIVVLFSVLLFLSFSTDPPNGKTGAPGDSICTECHNPQSSSISGFQTLEGVPDLINPGETYTLTLSNRYTEGSVVRSGFQMVVIDESNANVGTFGTAPASTAISVQGGRRYWEHTPAKFFGSDSIVSWTIDWQAPDGPIGDSIRFYSAGILGNGSQNQGDKTIQNLYKSLLDLPSSTKHENLDSQIEIFPNPANQFVNFRFNETEGRNNIYNLQGSLIEELTIRSNELKINTSNYSNGVYILRTETSNGIQTNKFLIQH